MGDNVTAATHDQYYSASSSDRQLWVQDSPPATITASQLSLTNLALRHEQIDGFQSAAAHLLGM